MPRSGNGFCSLNDRKPRGAEGAVAALVLLGNGPYGQPMGLVRATHHGSRPQKSPRSVSCLSGCEARWRRRRGKKTAHLLGLSAPWPPRHANPDKEKFVHPCSLGNSGQGRVRALCAPYRAHALSRVARSGAEDDQQAELNFRADCKSPSCFQPRAQPAAAWGFGSPVRPRCSAGRRRGYCLAAGSTPARERPRFPEGHSGGAVGPRRRGRSET